VAEAKSPRRFSSPARVPNKTQISRVFHRTHTNDNIPRYVTFLHMRSSIVEIFPPDLISTDVAKFYSEVKFSSSTV